MSILESKIPQKVKVLVKTVLFEYQKLVNQYVETPAYMFFKSRKIQCLEKNYLLIARRKIFSENRFAGIIDSKLKGILIYVTNSFTYLLEKVSLYDIL